MIESTEVRRWVTHMLCWSCGMYFSAAASSEKDQRQHELGFEHGLRPLHNAIEGGSHPRNG
jgi:hypothetical protein